MKKYISFYLILFFSANCLNAQIIDSKSVFSISAGKLIYGGPDDLFFPKGINNSGISFRADYLYTIHPWLKIGVESSVVLPGLPNSNNGFTEISSTQERMLIIGPNATFFTPFKETGWKNRVRFQIGLAPVAVAYLGERIVEIDNSVTNVETHQQESSTVEMHGPSNGFGLSFTPSIEYYIIQRFGIRLSCNTLLTSLKSDYTKEDLIIYSLNFGVFVPLTRNKKFYY
jgi:hypothetical protein